MAHTQKHQKAHLFWLPLLLLTWGAWLHRIGVGSLSFDESATYFVINRPPLEIVTYLLHAANEHPPVYYLLIRGWTALVGTSEFSLRLFSLEIGILLIALIGWTARIASRRVNGTALKRVDWLTAVFLAATPGMAFYARNARMYSLTAVWAAIASALLLRDWVMNEKRPSLLNIFLLITVNGLALLTHYYLLFFVITQPLTLLAGKRWRNLGIWSFIHGLPAFLGLLWLTSATGLQATIRSTFENDFAPLIAQHIPRLFANMLSSSMSTAQYYVLPIIIFMLLGGVIVAWKRQAAIGLWLLILLIVPFTLAHLLPRVPQTRYLVFVLPFIPLTMAHLIALPAALIRNRPLKWAAGGGWAIFIVWLLANTGMYHVLNNAESGYGYAMATISTYARDGDELLFYGPWQLIPFHYYGTEEIPPQTAVPPRSPPLLDPAQAAPVLEELLARSNRLWMVPMAVNDVDPDGFVWEWLRTHAHAVWQRDDVYLYLSLLTEEAEVKPLTLRFDDKIALTQIAHDPAPIPAGEPIRITLSWEFLRPLPEGAEVELSLKNEEGYVWVAAYSDIEEGQTLSYEGLTVPQDAPVGAYELRLRLLDNESGLPLLANGEEVTTLEMIQIAAPIYPPIAADLITPEGADFCPPEGAGQEACLILIGVDLENDHSQAGYPMRVNLHWQAASTPLPPLQARFQLIPDPPFYKIGVNHSPILTKTVPLSPPYPSNEWSANRLVTLPLVLSLPPDAPTGRAVVVLEVLDENGRIWASPHPIANIVIDERPTLNKLPSGLTRMEADFGGEIGLRGYTVEGEARPGGQLTVRYGWAALKRPSRVYAVFNHLVTADNTIIAQTDGWPQGGVLLTSQWQPDEYIDDNYIITIPADAPDPPYTLYVGFYDIETGGRLPAIQNGEHLLADRVPLALDN